MADHLYFAWFMLDDRPWVEHECIGGEVLVWSPPNPPWHLTAEGGLSPSFNCTSCGRHVILGPSDRCDTPEGLEYARCLNPNAPAPWRHPQISGSTTEGDDRG